MASEAPFEDRPDDRASDDRIQPLAADFIPTLQPVDEAQQGTEGPSAVPPLPAEPLVAYPPELRAARKPQPGFWFGVLATFLMFVTCQIAIPVVVAIAILVVHSARSGDSMKKLGEFGTKEGMKEFQKLTALPLLVSAHVPMILLGVVALRIFAGKYWYREIALRLPRPLHFALLLAGFPALPILAGGAYWLAQESIPGLGQLPALVVSQLAMIGMLSVAWLVIREQRGRDPKVELARSPLQRQLLVGAVVVVFALATAGGTLLLASHVFGDVPALAEMDQSMEDLVEETRTWPPLVAVLVIAVMPAFSEEIWCRAFLGRGLVGQYGVVCGVLVTSYFFGAIHVLPHQGAMAMLMGIVLHYAYITTRSLLAPMLLHFLNNGTSVLGPLLGKVAANIDTGPERVPVTIYVSAILLLVAVAWALYQTRAKIVRPSGGPEFPEWQPAYPGVALPPRYSGAIISSARPSIAATVLVVVALSSFASLFTWATLGYRIP
jgi:membrane protease YdiL (CAAX protease family)